MMEFRVTTSWDDGHKLDLRVADLLEKYGLTGTFYVSPENKFLSIEQRLSEDEIRSLSQRHEIGAHTLTHPNLRKISPRLVKTEIEGSKLRLEEIIGKPVTSFCYPYGHYNKAAVEAVKAAGFQFGRTINRFSYRVKRPLEAATSIHTYNHWSDVYKILRFANFNLIRAWKYRDWSELALAMFDDCAKYGGDFHLWGHSWEVEKFGDWEKLEKVLAYISKHRGFRPVVNGELFQERLQKKLMFSASYFPPKVGGLERYTHEIAKGAKEAGYDVVVLTSSETRDTTVEFSEEGLKVYRLGTDFRISNTPIGLAWFWEIRKIVTFESPDFINPHMPVPYLGDLVAGAARDIPLIVTYHSGSMKKRNLILDRIIEAYEIPILPFTLNKAGQIICSSDSVRNGFLKKYQNKSVTVTPGVDGAFFRQREAKTPTRNVLFIGNFRYRWKGLEYLLEAVKEVPGSQLWVVGEGEQIASERTEYLGVLRGEELINRIHQADVLVLPSISESESFGMVLVEAMSCGVPVIGSRIGGIPLVIDHGETGILVPPMNSKALAEAICETFNNPVATQARVKKASIKVAENFDWKKSIIPRYLNLIDETIQGKNRPNVTHVIGYYPPHLGGMELVAQTLANGATKKGAKVRVITSALGTEMRGLEFQDGIDINYLPAREIAHTPLAPGLFLALWRSASNTVFHLHAAQAYWPETVMLVSALKRTPFVVHFHLDVEASGRLGFLLDFYKKTLFALAMKRASKVVVLSSDQKKLVEDKYHLVSHKVCVIPNAVRPEFYSTDRKVEFHSPLRLLSVGRLTVQKRVDRLIEAISMVKGNVELRIVGDGEDRYKLENQVERLGLTNVHFLGIKRGENLLEEFEQADIFLIGSDKEGMPLSILEAMAKALPVIGSDVVGVREVVKDVGILVPPTPEGFAAEIDRFCSSPACLEKLSAQSLEAAHFYSWGNILDQFFDVYREVSS